MSVDIVSDKIHSRHDPKWSGRLGPAEGGGLLVCVACVIEMIESDDVSSVRKTFALSAVSGMFKSSPRALRDLLRQDHRVSLRFTASLLGMLHTMADQDTLEKVDQVLVQLLVALHSEMSPCFILDEIQKQLSNQPNMKHFFPTFTFLGNLMEAVPDVAHILVTQYVPMLENMFSALLHPDEALKASVLYAWIKLFKTISSSAAQSLPKVIRDRVCIVLLQILTNASSPNLIQNCVGLLWLLLQQGDAVSVLMNSPSSQIMCSKSQDSYTNDSQNLIQSQEQRSPDHCPLPLLLKKLLLSGDQMLQTASAKCIAAVLVHSGTEGSTPLIKADIPEFLFDRLASSRSEVMLWSVYSCLVLLSEDPLFFSQCHSVYGIDSLVCSLKQALQLTNLEVPKQGLLLLTEILERQPPSVRLFPTGPDFVSVSEALVAGLSCSCLLVATQAAHGTCALFSLNHQSRPVQYREIERLIEAITNRFSELSFPLGIRYRSSGSLKKSGNNYQATKSVGYLLKALMAFQAACRLAEGCVSDPALKENSFTSPSKHTDAQDSLESLCQRLLHSCDAVWIPTVMKTCEHVPNPQILQYFYLILTSQFTLVPSLISAFALKLASSGFYRLALEHKGLLCTGNRNPSLNTAACGFLQKLSMCLLSLSDPSFRACQHEEVQDLLVYNLQFLCYHPSDWPALLREATGPQLCEYEGPRATQYCLLIILQLALQQGDRLLADHTVFSSVMSLLLSVQDQGEALPRSVLRSAFYLLAATQDKSPNLDEASLNCVSKALSSCQSFSSLYIHDRALLHFICRYPEFTEKFGCLVLELWLSRTVQSTDADQAVEMEESSGSCVDRRQEPDTETVELLRLIEKYPGVILTLLDMVCNREGPLSGRALGVLEAVLSSQKGYETDLCVRLRLALLQVLQRVSMETVVHDLGRGHTVQVDKLPLLMKLLCLTLACDPPSSSSCCRMDEVHFKLLYHVTNIAGRLSSTNTESLLPTFSYLYCFLSLSSADSTDRAVAMLLCNNGLMDQLQTLLASSSSPTSPSGCPPSALLCYSHLLLSSLLTLQHFHSTKVQKCINLNLETALQRLLVQKRNTDNVLLVSYLRLLQVLLDFDLVTEVVCLDSGPSVVGPKPLSVEDGSLYPLGSRGAQLLTTAISGLLLQKHELLLKASVNCLSSLLGFLQRKCPLAAKFVTCQPWSRFLLYCLLNSGESCLLHPTILRVITLLLQYGSTTLLWDPDLLLVMEAVEKRGLKDLSDETAQALRQFLRQIQSSTLQPPPTSEHLQRVTSMMETLQTSAKTCSPSPTNNILRVGDTLICLADFAVK
ncbi:meiosis inhibitor protein 1 isoform X2 [Takifugu flavidus]|uniref:meiosis inhibitor protein 1 isoform X2 n=1 Tax=Takifugu flavidus TaxID=433684 RepID=UPI002544BFDC|nr:meiosis inhibitor protein 1 isoform X2 [Takifugu flavidus]